MKFRIFLIALYLILLSYFSGFIDFSFLFKKHKIITTEYELKHQGKRVYLEEKEIEKFEDK